jgi:multiple sugar transport system permease protein
MSTPVSTATPIERAGPTEQGASGRRQSRLFAYALLAPAFLLVLALMAYPLGQAVNLSLREGRVMNLDRVNELPITLDNYRRVLTRDSTWHSLWLSVVYTVASTSVAFVIGLGAALILNRRFAGRRVLRTLVLLPWAVPGVIVSIGFLWLLDSSYGVVNYFLRTSGLITSDPAWFFNRDTALTAVILPTVWKGYPFFCLMLLAALQSIPSELYEAARVDGANALHVFRAITWPGIQTTAVLAIVLNGLWAFREFDFIYATTRGGPSGATETLAIRIYNEAFGFFQLGIASALGLMTLMLAAVVVLATFPLLKKEFF